MSLLQSSLFFKLCIYYISHRFLTSAMYCRTLGVAPSNGSSDGIGSPGGTVNVKFCKSVVMNRNRLDRAIISPMHLCLPTPNGWYMSGNAIFPVASKNLSGRNSVESVQWGSSIIMPAKHAITMAFWRVREMVIDCGKNGFVFFYLWNVESSQFGVS